LATSSIGNKILKAPMTSVFNSTYSSIDQVDFSAIIKIEVGAKAKTSAATVLLDALKIDDNNTYNSQYGLISRSVLAKPKTKKQGVEMDIEYKINLGFL
jgi:outer membrane receptor protein involved in Fe transport